MPARPGYAAVALLALAFLAGAADAGTRPPYATISVDDLTTTAGDQELVRQMQGLPLTRVLRVPYRAHDGRRHRILLLVPREARGLLPLVLAPHGRGGDAVHACATWGDLPGYAQVAVACADDPGRVVPHFSWGAPGAIGDLARMPRIISRFLPHLLAPDRVFAVGDSMGGQEVLLLVAGAPGLLRGAVAMDPTTDLARRYAELAYFHNGPQDWQPLMREEVGGTPAQVPGAYAARSPIRVAAAIARSGVPLGVWWSRRDRELPTRPGTQGQRLLRRLAALHPLAPVCQRVGSWPHGWPWEHALWAALRFLGLMHGPTPVALREPGTASFVAGPMSLRAISTCQA